MVGAPIIIACSDDSLDKEVDNMAGKGKTLRELMSNRGKGQSLKVHAQSQAQDLPPAAPQVPFDLGLKVNPDLKKKRPVDIPEEGEVAPARPSSKKPLAGRGVKGPIPWKAEMRRIGLKCALIHAYGVRSWS